MNDDFEEWKRKQRGWGAKTMLPAYLYIIGMVVLFVGAIFFAIWFMFIADCKSLGWVSIPSLPSRCLDLEHLRDTR